MAEVIQLSVDTGAIVVDINDRGEIIGRIRFNPNDLDIARRYESVVSSLEKVSVPEKASMEDVFKVTDEIKRQMDYLLNANVSEEIFAKCNPLTLTASGDFYVENVMEGIAGLIEKTTNQRVEKKRAKIQKATAKYHK